MWRSRRSLLSIISDSFESSRGRLLRLAQGVARFLVREVGVPWRAELVDEGELGDVDAGLRIDEAQELETAFECDRERAMRDLAHFTVCAGLDDGDRSAQAGRVGVTDGPRQWLLLLYPLRR
jgi:hypothetical protein